MANKLFDNWTWRRHLPEPFNDPSIAKTRTDVVSEYNTASSPKATLHAPTLSAILAYINMQKNSGKGAIGMQGEDMIMAEYPSHTGEIHTAIFNKKNGKFTCGIYSDATAATPTSYVVKEDKNSGSALFFALMPLALQDKEFTENYDELSNMADAGFPDMELASQKAVILCDNFYRRIENNKNLGQASINTNIAQTGNISPLTALNIDKGVYNPTDIIAGDFEILKPGEAPKEVVPLTKHEVFCGQYALSEREFTSAEKALIPQLESWYVIPPEVVNICKHAKLTGSTKQPMRNFMMRGPAGTGKTEGAKAIAAGLGLPYMFLTCSANTEIYELLGQILPDVKNGAAPARLDKSYPTFEDIQMDPPTAYHKLTGVYDENVNEEEVYNKLLEVIAMDLKAEPEQEIGTQKFMYVDTPLVKAIRNGYCIEIQEPSIIANPGVLVGLNSLLDRCNTVTLPTGETIERHPDTIVIVTTNSDYNGCKDMNQSVISRMNLVYDIEDVGVSTMMERASGITGCTDLSALKKMAEAIKDMAERCKETMITDGSCGFREYVAWVQSYAIVGDFIESAKYTVLSAISADPENRAEIMSSCLEPKFVK